ncbi:hypothetical protein C6503_14165 [Candidatus Poribacteria bacterium]|nr:MAG: hypothetical protein C6503_14165 [Candidatus Poribacteria bacterium]
MTLYTWHYDNIPSSWEPVLERLKKFETLAQQISKAKKEQKIDLSEMLKTFYTHHDALMTDTRARLQHAPTRYDDEATLDAAFVEAVWLSIEHYPALVHHPEIENLDTAGSKIFTLFTPDAPATPGKRESLKTQLQRAFDLDSETVDKLNRQLSIRTSPLQHRHQIMESLETRFNLVSNNPQLDADILQLFRSLYPGAPFVAGEVKLVKTSSALYFCLPTEPQEKAQASNISADERSKEHKMPQRPTAYYEKFLRKIWEVEPFAHFPVFGTFNAEKLDLTFRQEIAADTELSLELVTSTLTRMVGVLPLAELDKYLIHDTWGHQWQESLLDFEEPYTALTLFKRPLSLTETALVFGKQTSFADTFIKTKAGTIALDSEKLQQFIDAELYERAIIAFTPILAEMLADVVEYKFLELYPEQEHLLPSSSLLKAFPSKLDLTLVDLRTCFAHASEVFQNWIASEPIQQQLHKEICEKLDIPDKATKHKELSHVLSAAVELCKAQLFSFYQPEWTWETVKMGEDGGLKLNAFSFAALNFLRIHTALIQTYEDLSQIKTPYVFKDILVLAMGTFFERNPQQNIWELDGFLTGAFLPRWQKLAAVDSSI